jgi:hypothetical protein
VPADPVRQHWVPKVYLRAFCAAPIEREQIHVRDLADGRNFFASIDRVAVKRHFYTLAPGSPSESYVVEEALGKIESDVGPILAALRAEARLPSAAEEMRVLAEFVATLHMRTRQGLQMIHGHREEVRAGLRLTATNASAATDFRERLVEFDSEEMRELFAKSAVVVGRRISEVLLRMHWRLLRATEGKYFITSENPVFSYHPSETRWGLGTPGNHTLFPVSPSLLIHLSNEAVIPGEGLVEVPAQGVHGLNGLALLSAEQYLYSHRPFEEIADLIQDREPGTDRTFGPAREGDLV